jgi:hypothetical protein
MHWGVVGYEEDEQDRPQYVGVSTASPVDGSEMTYFPSDEASKRTILVNVS